MSGGRDRRWRVLGAGAFAIVALVAALVVAAGSGAADQVVAPVPRLVWADCGDGLQCATARVPLDYDHPRGAQISLALARLPATDPARRIGSLFYNPGGPGESAIAYLRLFATTLPAAVRARYDLVGMDPRGTGGSTPVRCFDSTAEQQKVFPEVNDAPSSLRQFIRHMALAAQLAAQCDARNGDLLNHLSTANVARDMDLIRQAVGDTELNYYGTSYGTYLGQTYAALFPRRVRRMVLDGVLLAPAWRSGPSTPGLRERGNAGGAATLDQFFVLCAEAGARCAFAAGGDPATKYARLLDRLRARTVTLPDGSVWDYGLVLKRTLEGLTFASQWAATAQILQELYTASAAPQGQPTHPAAPPQPQAGAAYRNVFEAELAIKCGETDNPHNPLAYPRLAAAADRATPYAGSFWAYDSFGCVFWTARDRDRYTGSFHVTTAHPVLITNLRYDWSTPYENAVDAVGLLPGSRLLTVNGWGHTVLLQSPLNTCTSGYLQRYLLAGTLPAAGAQCGPSVVPFHHRRRAEPPKRAGLG